MKEDEMSWLDNLLSVPAIGIRIRSDLSFMNQFQNSVHKILEILKDKYGEIEFKKADIWGYLIRPAKVSGFNYIISFNKINTFYKYRLQQKIISGKFPTVEYPDLKLYSDILNDNLKEILFVFEELKEIKGIKYDMIGIVADSTLPKDGFPPGIISWIDYIGKPWGKKVSKLEMTLLAKLHENETYYEQCHHSIKFDEPDPDNEVEFKLDWQRVSNEPISLETNRLLDDLNSCLSKANIYFEKFGEGNLNYE